MDESAVKELLLFEIRGDVCSWISYFASDKLNLNSISSQLRTTSFFLSIYGFHTTTKQWLLYLFIAKLCKICMDDEFENSCGSLCVMRVTLTHIYSIYREIFFTCYFLLLPSHNIILIIPNHAFSFGFGIKLNNHPFLLLQTHAY